MIEDFTREVLLAIGERHDEIVGAMAKGTGVVDYAQYREMVGAIRAYEAVMESLQAISAKWQNG